MDTREFQRLQTEEKARAREKKADRFWQAFRLTEHGRVKSTLLLNSFCLCVVFAAVYFAAFYYLVDVLHPLVSGKSVWIINLTEALIPAIAGTAVCCLSDLLFKNKQMLPVTYLWLLALALACFITMLCLLRGEPQAQRLFLQFFALFVPAPVLLGGGVSLFLYSRHRKKKTSAISAER